MSVEFDHRRTEPPRRVPIDRHTLWGCGAMLLIAAGLGYGVLWPAVQAARDAARTACSQCHLKQMVLALHNYHDNEGAFPPVYLADEEGRPMHSWRVLILPYIEQCVLYDRYDFNRPWNDPHNLQLAGEMPSTFRSGFSEEEWAQGLTPYLAITGPDTALRESTGRTLSELGGEVKHKLAVLEYYSQPVLWTELVDITPQRILAEYSQIMDNRQKGINVMVMDGPITFVPADAPPEDLEAGFYVGDGRKFVQGKGRVKETQ